MTRHAERCDYWSELLSSEDGMILMVRGKTLDEVLETAHEEAAADGCVLAEPAMVRMVWLRKIPCPGTEHETDGGMGMPCDGIKDGYHVIESKPGRGAIRGALVDVTFADDLEDGDPRKTRYLGECAAMERRASDPAPSPDAAKVAEEIARPPYRTRRERQQEAKPA